VRRGWCGAFVGGTVGKPGGREGRPYDVTESQESPLGRPEGLPAGWRAARVVRHARVIPGSRVCEFPFCQQSGTGTPGHLRFAPVTATPYSCRRGRGEVGRPQGPPLRAGWNGLLTWGRCGGSMAGRTGFF